MMELYIETLTGTAFELRVSPYETVQDVKARIQHLEGIPISQQHLVWQSVELQDDFCLRDYSITDGSTLKLVLTMRGGPINTRRFPVEDQALHEMAEYLSDAGYLVDDGGGGTGANRPVTVIVYHNGDQISFYRIVDPNSTSPLSETISAAYLYEDEDEEEEAEGGASAPPERVVDDDKTREKMKLLRMKMENMTVGKKPKKKLAPRPPSSHRPNSRLRRFTTSAGRVSLLNRNPCLPPVAHTSPGGVDGDNDDTAAPRVSISSPPRVPTALMTQPLMVDGGTMHVNKDVSEVDCPAASPLPARRLESIERAPFKLSGMRSPSGGSGEPISPSEAKARSPPAAEMLESLWHRAPSSTAHLPRKWDPAGYTDTQLSLLRSLNSRLPPATGISGIPSASVGGTSSSAAGSLKLGDDNSGRTASLSTSNTRTNAEHSYSMLKKTTTAPSLANLPTSSSTKLGGGAGRNSKKPSVILESLDASEVQAMSGMLTSIVQNANKSRTNGGTFVLERSAVGISGRLSSTDGRLTSTHLQKLPTTREGRIVSPTHHLPPVKQKKKPSKRCFLCTKKTGLATSYLCRCGNNYCALHRYAESHECTFDYKTEGRKILEQSNPVIMAPKLPKI